jgi:hypothetical protein
MERSCVYEVQYQLYQVSKVLLVHGGCEERKDMFFVVNASRISSHIGANRFVGSQARSGGFAQYNSTTACTDVRSVFTAPPLMSRFRCRGCQR